MRTGSRDEIKKEVLADRHQKKEKQQNLHRGAGPASYETKTSNLNPKLILLALRRHRLVFAFEGGHDGMPGEDRAFHARRIFMDTGEHREFANSPGICR